MQIGGIAWWLLIGMFGWGAAVGFLSTVLAAKRLVKSTPGEWFEPLFRIFFALVALVVIPLLAGLVAIALTFVAHRLGWDALLPYPAGAGYGFLALAAIWFLRLARKPSSARK